MWRKILYSEQPFEDNYVHNSFLAQLRTNGTLAWGGVLRRVGILMRCCVGSPANVKEHDYWSMVRSAVAIAQQICAVMIFFVSVRCLPKPGRSLLLRSIDPHCLCFL